MGVDTAEGLKHGDYSVREVLDVNTGEQSAIWHGNIAAAPFAAKIFVKASSSAVIFVNEKCSTH